MAKMIVFLSALCVGVDVCGVEIQVINKTPYTCRINQALHDFSCSANLMHNKFIGCRVSCKDLKLAAGQELFMSFTQKPKQTTDSAISYNEKIVFVGESGVFFKKNEFRFPVILMRYETKIYVPVLLGRRKDFDTTQLYGKNGFFIKKYMSPRYDRYILEINRDENERCEQ